MKVEIKTIDKVIAKKILQGNTHNRSAKDNAVTNYANMMSNGEWKENGEAIIVDRNLVVKDGQHRLMAIVKSDTVHRFVFVSDVDPDVMDTIDTGKNRSLADILKLEGFTQSNNKASLVTSIIKYNRDSRLTNRQGSKADRNASQFVSNAAGLDFAIKHKENLDKFMKIIVNIHGVSKKVVPISTLSRILYFIAGFDVKEIHIDFMQYLSGNKYEKGTAASYVFDSIYNAKQSKSPLTTEWINKASIRAWNMFVNGNAEVRYIKVTSNTNEKPIKI